MSSDDYFDDDNFDADLLQQVDAIEAAHTQAAAPPASRPAPPRSPQKPPRPPSPARTVIDVDDSYDYDFDTLNDIDLQAFDKACNEASSSNKTTQPAPARSKPALNRTTSAATVQMTLFGGVAQASTALTSHGPSSSRSTMQRNNSNVNNLFTGRPNKTKKWDHTAFAKSGWKKPKTTKGKEKARSFDDGPEDEWEEEEEVEFEQFPAPFISLGCVSRNILP